jgi:carboxypeptidase Taq
VNEHYRELMRLRREAATLGSVAGLASWDQETYMPAGGADARAEQAALLAGLIHERSTSPRLGELLARCEADASLNAPGSETAAELREIRRDYDHATKLPAELVRELAETGSKAQHVWKDARAKSDFALFAPWLTKMLSLTRQKADFYGVPAGGERYDALLDEYEPGMTARRIESVFTPLRDELAAFLRSVTDGGTPPDTEVLHIKASPEAQHRFGLRVLEAMGFDLSAGRLDITAHPFCSGFAPGDTRLTTRYRDQHFTDALYSTMHEGGHGLYEQGLPKKEKFGSPLGESVSLGIHESQSRLWENFVGRSPQFWEWVMPIARAEFGSELDGVSPERMTRAVNTATPSLIRVEADESTYNLHVMLRFEIERGLLSGRLEVGDVPEAWNAAVENFLGVRVPDDARGCLQDVHWSFGLIGYFPTYTLGNLYAGQLWEKLLVDIPDLEERMRRGDFADLLAWLREKIHRHGRRYPAAELAERATGHELDAGPLLRHLERRVKPAYAMG